MADHAEAAALTAEARVGAEDADQEDPEAAHDVAARAVDAATDAHPAAA